MKEALVKLLKVRSIVTLVCVIVFAILSLTGIVSGAEFLTIFGIIIGFFFGTKSKEGNKADTEEIIEEDYIGSEE